MVELPPKSRISLRIDREGMTITVPRSSGKSKGNWGIAAIASFLTVSFITQGIISGNHTWTAAGLFCFIIAAWQLVSLRGLLSTDTHTKLQVTPGGLVKIAGPEDAPQRQDWQRAAVSDVRVERDSASNQTGLCLHFKDNLPPAWLLSDGEPAELNWIAEQIRTKWGMGAG